MSGWRARIFVPDSEDDLDSCTSSESLSSLDSLFPESLEGNGQSDLQIRSNAAAGPTNGIASKSTNAVTTSAEGHSSISGAPHRRLAWPLRSEDISEDELTIDHTDGYDVQTQIRSNRSVEVVIVNERRLPRSVEDSSSGFAERTFRKRNPIQLHPYLLEGEKYRNILKSRGIQPVAIARESQGQSSESQNVEEPAAGTESENEFSLDRISAASLPSSQVAVEDNQVPPDPLRTSHTTITYDTDDELPDIGAIVDRHVLGGVQRGRKRQKTFQHRSPKRYLDASDKRLGTPNVSTVTDDTQLAIFDLPPSPASSPAPHGAVLPPANLKNPLGDFRVPRGLTPPALPTPVTSSGVKPQRYRISSSSSESDSAPADSVNAQVSTKYRRSRPLYVLSDTSSSAGEEDDSQVRRLQKRMKGVLPASWLKLDHHAQSAKDRQGNKANAVVDGPSKDATSPQRGVAQRVFRPQSSRSDQIFPLELRLEDSDSQLSKKEADVTMTEDHRPQHVGSISSPVEVIHDPPLVYEGEAGEEDFVDPMLPTSSRARWKRWNHGGRQVTLEDSFRNRDRIEKPKTSYHRQGIQNRARVTQSKLNPSRSSTRARNRKPPLLSILDVEDSTWKKEEAPMFLRVAARAAMQLQSKGRQDIDSKHVHLKTRADTADAFQTIRDWGSGKLKRISPSRKRFEKYSKGDLAREPLRPCAGNKQNQVRRLSRQNVPPLETARVGARKIVPGRKANQPPQANQTNRSEPRVANLSDSVAKVGRRESYMSASVHGKRPVAREAQLEALETNFEGHNPEATFRRHLDIIDEYSRRQGEPGIAPLSPEGGEFVDLEVFEQNLEKENSTKQKLKPQVSSTLKPRRKRPAKRINIYSEEYVQNSPPVFDLETDEVDPPSRSQISVTALRGLGNYGSSYTIDFGTCPMDRSASLDEDTFVGSGDFGNALLIQDRDLDCEALVVEVDNAISRQLPWNESTAEELQTLRVRISGILRSVTRNGVDERDAALDSDPRNALFDITKQLRRKIQYCSSRLWFSDSVDRQSFCSKMSEFISQSCSDLIPRLQGAGSSGWTADVVSPLTKLVAYLLIISWQTLAIAKSDHVDPGIYTKIKLLFSDVSKAAALWIIDHGIDELKRSQNENRCVRTRESAVSSKTEFVELVVVLFNLLDKKCLSTSSLWDVVSEILTPRVAAVKEVAEFEALWSTIFTLLPYADFEATGFLSSDRTKRNRIDNGTLIKELLSKLFAFYTESSAESTATLNDYVRATLSRCLVLISRWDFRNCELIINSAFDFFASRGLSPLRREAAAGSPQFLDNLSDTSALDPEPGDRSFHTFLKIMAAGLRKMQEAYSKKRVGALVWRYIPNHGRTYRKDQQIRHEDIEALRNHHDLLCVLYWASPTGFRPRTDLIRSLVDFSISHREACRLNVRAWSILVKYQMSTGEDSAQVEPFAIWFKDILHQTLSQYHLARTEATADYEKATTQVKSLFTNEYLWSLVRENQSQVLAYLTDAVRGLLNAVKSAKNFDTAEFLIKNSGFLDIFRLLETKPSNLEKIFSESLLVIKQLLQIKGRQTNGATGVTQKRDESQDYGEWPDMDDDSDELTGTESGSVQDAVWQLLSNAFGSDGGQSDKILKETLETWVAVITKAVESGKSCWSDYLEDQGSTSWFKLRRTENARKFGPYFWAKILEQNSVAVEEHCGLVVGVWLVSLVERDALLKFQSLLTAALCKAYPRHPLLRNMPVHTHWLLSSSTEVHTLDLRTLRISILSAVLENMRSSLEEAAVHDFAESAVLQRKYGALLRRVVGSMKANYQEMQHGSQVKGAYVQFVQRVVELMQQYTVDICPIDRFFTDPAAFPQPALDPTYIVSRLRSHDARYANAKTLKKLAIFVQTIAARAVVDSEADSLRDQLYSAMDSWERGAPAKPSLRSILACGILPAYISVSLAHPRGWLLAAPLLLATAATLERLLYRFDAKNRRATSAAGLLLDALLLAICNAMHTLAARPDAASDPAALHALALLTRVTASAVSPLDFVHRQGRRVEASRLALVGAEDALEHIAAVLRGRAASTKPLPAPPPEEVQRGDQFAELRAFCARELRALVERDWAAWGGGHRGGSRVVGMFGTVEGERDAVLGAIDEFRRVRACVEGGGLDDDAADGEGEGAWEGTVGGLVV